MTRSEMIDEAVRRIYPGHSVWMASALTLENRFGLGETERILDITIPAIRAEFRHVCEDQANAH